MKPKDNDRYSRLSDREIVNRIITAPYDEDAAVYLIYSRYSPLCVSVCLKTLGGIHNLDQLQSELFIHLKGKMLDWQILRAFQWRSTLGRWLSIITYNLSLELRRILIENDNRNTSIDNGIEVPVDDESQRENRYRMVLLIEAINMLDNTDQKFVVIKRLQGYSSKETAKMLQAEWDKNNIVRYNRKREPVVPDSGYIDNLFKRGYDKTKQIFKSLER